MEKRDDEEFKVQFMQKLVPARRTNVSKAARLSSDLPHPHMWGTTMTEWRVEGPESEEAQVQKVLYFEGATRTRQICRRVEILNWMCWGTGSHWGESQMMVDHMWANFWKVPIRQTETLSGGMVSE